MPEKHERYLDENLSDKEKESGRPRQPSSNEALSDHTKGGKRETVNPDRPDEFGDGDRRS